MKEEKEFKKCKAEIIKRIDSKQFVAIVVSNEGCSLWVDASPAMAGLASVIIEDKLKILKTRVIERFVSEEVD